MLLSPSEKATLHFYEWEYRGRGYYHFDEIVDIEPPYIPFQHISFVDNSYIDDGIAPNLLDRFIGLFENKKEAPQENRKPLQLVPNPVGKLSKLTGFSFSFSKGQDVSSLVSNEFLNILAYTKETLSFEILGTKEAISIQIACSTYDRKRVEANLKAYFPSVQIQDINIFDIPFNRERNVAIADFGLQDEYMRPTSSSSNSFSIDPLTSFIATLDSLSEGQTALFQILFKGVTSPISKDILYAVSDGHGGSFFADAPEMVKCAEEKVSNPLFACVMRIATQGQNDNQSSYLAQELARGISSISRSQYNKLIPLTNEGYDYDNHLYNVYHRTSNRLGMYLNSHELVTFLHYPNKSIVSEKLHPQSGKTKLLPKECINQKYVLGINSHNCKEQEVSINDDIFSKHLVIAGSTGTGKTHLLKQLIAFDIEFQNATFVIDPHGDLVLDILKTIPEQKKDNVIYINIADEDYSFGFNIFSAPSEAEKTVLASDLASAFADTWISSGDRINSVLQKTISTLIYSEKEASILDMKRFLLEKDFRNDFIKTLDDPILQYYWKNEFPLVRRNELSPLLLRIDSFMQTRLLRNVFCQTEGIDFKELVQERKLVLIQLSVGLIGLENSKFLARLIIAKINQIAFSRQNIDIHNRQPIHLYIDESHNYANSPVIEQILSGARKYSLSLVLVLQHLEQVGSNMLNSILSNTATQIFFRQSEKDSKRISSSFSFFDAEDFMELDIGEALVRVNKRSNDFNLKTLPLHKHIPNEVIKEYIIRASQQKYAQGKEDISELLKTLLPQQTIQKEAKKTKAKEVRSIETLEEKLVSEPQKSQKENIKNEVSEDSELEQQKEKYFAQRKERETLKRHRYLQTYIGQLAQQRGFKITIEKQTKDGKKIDVVLEQDKLIIAIEVAITNSLDYEVQNIKKCIDDGYSFIWAVADSKVHLSNIEKRVKKKFSSQVLKNVSFVISDVLVQKLDSLSLSNKPQTKRIQGYRVSTSFKDDVSLGMDIKQNEITDMILHSMRKKKKK